MSPSTREKLILLLLPSAVIALIWWGWFRPTSRLTSNERAAVAARAAAPPADAILQENAKQIALTREITELKQQKEMYLQRWSHLRDELGYKDNRPQALERLTTVFSANALTILHEQPLAAQTDKAFKGIDELHRRLGQPVETTFPELKPVANSKSASADAKASAKAGDRAIWEIDFAGAYDEVHAALQQLMREDPDFMPLALRMAPADPSLTLRRWTLVISL